MFLVNTKRQKESLCVHGTGRRWDGVLISTRTTFRQLDFNQPLIPRKPAHRNYEDHNNMEALELAMFEHWLETQKDESQEIQGEGEDFVNPLDPTTTVDKSYK
jgi:hypothetical protein